MLGSRGQNLMICPARWHAMASDPVDHLDDRGRATVRPKFRARLAEGFVQILTPDGVLLASVPKRVRSRAPRGHR
jgi:hypothetical protein